MIKNQFCIKWTSLTAIFFLLFEQIALAAPQVSAHFPASEVAAPVLTQTPRIPSRLAHTEFIHDGTGPLLIHIQEPHGQYDAQLKIRELLHYLKRQYGVRLILTEGSAFKLDPALARFAPASRPVHEKILHRLAQSSLISGMEMFLSTQRDVQALGIEEAGPYLDNGRAFAKVLTEKEKSDRFIGPLQDQLNRLFVAYAGKGLRALLEAEDDFDQGRVSLRDHVRFLKENALRILKIDLSDPGFQLDWPMLVRFIRLSQLLQEIPGEELGGQRNQFVAAAAKLIGRGNPLMIETEKFFAEPLSGEDVRSPQELADFTEKLIAALPVRFPYGDYPWVMKAWGIRLIRSEIQPDLFQKEIQELGARMARASAPSEAEKKIVELHERMRLLKKTLNLELTPEDYQKLLETPRIAPQHLIEDSSSLASQAPGSQPVRFDHVKEVQKIFETALDFYAGAKERDRIMIRKAEHHMQANGRSAAVVITGGFHSGPFREYFSRQDYRYILVSPKVEKMQGRSDYLQTVTRSYDASKIKRSTYAPVPSSVTALNDAVRLADFPARRIQEIYAVTERVLPKRSRLAGLRVHQMPLFKAYRSLIRLDRSQANLPARRTATEKPQSGRRSELRITPEEAAKIPILLSAGNGGTAVLNFEQFHLAGRILENDFKSGRASVGLIKTDGLLGVDAEVNGRRLKMTPAELEAEFARRLTSAGLEVFFGPVIYGDAEFVEEFYAVHRTKVFFERDLKPYMTEPQGFKPFWVRAKGDGNAVEILRSVQKSVRTDLVRAGEKVRNLMHATDPDYFKENNNAAWDEAQALMRTREIPVRKFLKWLDESAPPQSWKAVYDLMKSLHAVIREYGYAAPEDIDWLDKEIGALSIPDADKRMVAEGLAAWALLSLDGTGLHASTRHVASPFMEYAAQIGNLLVRLRDEDLYRREKIGERRVHATVKLFTVLTLATAVLTFIFWPAHFWIIRLPSAWTLLPAAGMIAGLLGWMRVIPFSRIPAGDDWPQPNQDQVVVQTFERAYGQKDLHLSALISELFDIYYQYQIRAVEIRLDFHDKRISAKVFPVNTGTGDQEFQRNLQAANREAGQVVYDILKMDFVSIVAGHGVRSELRGESAHPLAEMRRASMSAVEFKRFIGWSENAFHNGRASLGWIDASVVTLEHVFKPRFEEMLERAGFEIAWGPQVVPDDYLMERLIPDPLERQQLRPLMVSGSGIRPFVVISSEPQAVERLEALVREFESLSFDPSTAGSGNLIHSFISREQQPDLYETALALASPHLSVIRSVVADIRSREGDWREHLRIISMFIGPLMKRMLDNDGRLTAEDFSSVVEARVHQDPREKVPAIEALRVWSSLTLSNEDGLDFKNYGALLIDALEVQSRANFRSRMTAMILSGVLILANAVILFLASSPEASKEFSDLMYRTAVYTGAAAFAYFVFGFYAVFHGPVRRVDPALIHGLHHDLISVQTKLVTRGLRSELRARSAESVASAPRIDRRRNDARPHAAMQPSLIASRNGESLRREIETGFFVLQYLRVSGKLPLALGEAIWNQLFPIREILDHRAASLDEESLDALGFFLHRVDQGWTTAELSRVRTGLRGLAKLAEVDKASAQQFMNRFKGELAPRRSELRASEEAVIQQIRAALETGILEEFVTTMERLVVEKKVRAIGKLVEKASADREDWRRMLSQWHGTLLKRLIYEDRHREHGKMLTAFKALDNIGIGEVVFVAAEMRGLSLGGGLGMVIGELAEVLSDMGISITVIIPVYDQANGHKHKSFRDILRHGVKIGRRRLMLTSEGTVSVPIGPAYYSAAFDSPMKSTIPGDPERDGENADPALYDRFKAKVRETPVYSIHHGNLRILLMREPEMADRIYNDQIDSDTELQRMIWLSRGSLEVMTALNIKPDVIQYSEKDTALIPAFIQEDPAYQALRSVPIVDWVHHNVYQGRRNTNQFVEWNSPQGPRQFYIDSYPRLGIPPDAQPFEQYGRFADPGNLNMLNPVAAGLRHLVKPTDAVVVVSPRYGFEIATTNEFGEGLQTLYRPLAQSGRLFGISNGIFTEESGKIYWGLGESLRREAGLEALMQEFHEQEYRTHLPAYKAAALQKVQEVYGLTKDPDAQLFSFIGRVTEQKGIGLLHQMIDGKSVLERALEDNPKLQVFMGGPLAKGDPDAEALKAATDYLSQKFPGRIAARYEFVSRPDTLRMMLASRFFFMGSRYEPGGITQLEASRAGTVSVARNVGGIRATLKDITVGGTAFIFEDFTGHAVLHALWRAKETFRDAEFSDVLIRRAAAQNHDWRETVAPRYQAFYQRHQIGNFPHLHPRAAFIKESRVDVSRRSELRGLVFPQMHPAALAHFFKPELKSQRAALLLLSLEELARLGFVPSRHALEIYQPFLDRGFHVFELGDFSLSADEAKRIYPSLDFPERFLDQFRHRGILLKGPPGVRESVQQILAEEPRLEAFRKAVYVAHESKDTGLLLRKITGRPVLAAWVTTGVLFAAALFAAGIFAFLITADFTGFFLSAIKNIGGMISAVVMLGAGYFSVRSIQILRETTANQEDEKNRFQGQLETFLKSQESYRQAAVWLESEIRKNIVPKGTLTEVRFDWLRLIPQLEILAPVLREGKQPGLRLAFFGSDVHVAEQVVADRDALPPNSEEHWPSSVVIVRMGYDVQLDFSRVAGSSDASVVYHEAARSELRTDRPFKDIDRLMGRGYGARLVESVAAQIADGKIKPYDNSVDAFLRRFLGEKYFKVSSWTLVVALALRRAEELSDSRRSELRIQNMTEPNKTQKGIEDRFRLEFRLVRQEILPLAMTESQSADALVVLLSGLLERQVHFGKGGIAQSEPEPVLVEVLGDAAVIDLSQNLERQVSSTGSESGTILLDVRWLRVLVERNPRAFLILAEAMRRFRAAHPEAKPLAAVLGDETDFASQVRKLLLARFRDLGAEERQLAQPWIQRDLSAFSHTFESVPADKLETFLSEHSYGVSMLLSKPFQGRGRSGLEGSFILDPDTLADADLLAVPFLTPSLLKAAHLVQGIPILADRLLIIQENMKHILPGARRDGNYFRVDIAQLVQFFAARQALDRSA